MPTTQSVCGMRWITMSMTGERVCQEITRSLPSASPVPNQWSISTCGSIQKNCTSHFQYCTWIGAPRPSASRIFCFTSGGTVSGTCAIGSPGASCRRRKMTMLMNSKVGTERTKRRMVYVSI